MKSIKGPKTSGSGVANSSVAGPRDRATQMLGKPKKKNKRMNSPSGRNADYSGNYGAEKGRSQI